MAAALFSIDEVSIEITDAEGRIALVTIRTPAGSGRLLGQLRFDEKVLYVDKAHVEGLAPGDLGRQEINVILRKILVEANVEQVVI